MRSRAQLGPEAAPPGSRAAADRSGLAAVEQDLAGAGCCVARSAANRDPASTGPGETMITWPLSNAR